MQVPGLAREHKIELCFVDDLCFKSVPQGLETGHSEWDQQISVVVSHIIEGLPAKQRYHFWRIHI